MAAGRDGTHRGLGVERHHAGTRRPWQNGGTVHPCRRRGDELLRLRWRDRIHADRFHRLRVFRGRADHVAECESLAIGAVGGACVVRTSAPSSAPAPRSPSTFSRIPRPTVGSAATAAVNAHCPKAHVSKCANRNALCDWRDCPACRSRTVSSPNSTCLSSAGENRRAKTGGTHHGQSFPRTGKPESGK